MKLCIREIEEVLGAKAVLQPTGALPAPDAEADLSCAEFDSRRVLPGGVFFAESGERTDGHKFIASVFEAGAALVICRKTPQEVESEFGIPAGSWGSYLVTPDPYAAMRRIAAFYRSKLRIPVVGITGSVGKTSTKEMIASVLSRSFHVLKTEANLNNDLGVPVTLLRIREEHTAAVVDMGISDFGEMRVLAEMVRPDVAVFTNIGQCHLEQLGDRDGVYRAKTEMVEYMNPEGTVCAFGGDDKLAGLLREQEAGEPRMQGKTLRYFGWDGDGTDLPLDVRITECESKGLEGSEAVLEMDGMLQMIRVCVPGAHMVLNAAAGACVGLCLGMTPGEIAEGIEALQEVGGRGHIVQAKDLTVIDDCYNANPASMRASIDLLGMAEGEKAAILGDMFELGAEELRLHEGVGVYAVRAGLSHLICVGERCAAMYEAAAEAAEESAGEGYTDIRYFADKEKLLKALREDREDLLPSGCAVLVKASHGMHFEEIVKELLG